MLSKDRKYLKYQTIDELAELKTVQRQKAELRLKKENLEEFLQME